MEKIFKKDISEKKEFVAEDSLLKQLDYNSDSGMYLYGRYFFKNCRKEKIGQLMGYEIIKPVKYKNPDGTIVGVYPSNSQFGSNGWYITANSSEEEIQYFFKHYHKNLSWIDYITSKRYA